MVSCIDTSSSDILVGVGAEVVAALTFAAKTFTFSKLSRWVVVVVAFATESSLPVRHFFAQQKHGQVRLQLCSEININLRLVHYKRANWPKPLTTQINFWV